MISNVYVSFSVADRELLIRVEIWVVESWLILDDELIRVVSKSNGDWWRKEEGIRNGYAKVEEEENGKKINIWLDRLEGSGTVINGY